MHTNIYMNTNPIKAS